MNKVQVIANGLFMIACAIFVNSKSFAEPLNLTKLKSEVRAYHDSGAYQREIETVINSAEKYIEHRVLINNKRSQPEKLAIVLDIDETSLSNYTFMSKMDFAYDKEKNYHQVISANDPAIQSVLGLYHKAIQDHIAVFFITGRTQSEFQATEKNLKSAGFTQWAGLYVRPNNYHFDSVAPFKTKAREAITKQGYTIIACIGDQESDLQGGFSEKTFKLPNPYYFIN